MTLPRSIKVPSRRTKIVAVIASQNELERAARVRRLPDYFELRLDGLTADVTDLPSRISRLRAPLIITARDFREGGLQRLTIAQRCRLLRKFLPLAACLDVELRAAARMNDLLGEAGTRGVQIIISVHDFDRSPAAKRLLEWFEAAREFKPQIFKVAVRTDSREELARLIDFFEENRRHANIAAMGIGKLGRESRREFIRHGSALAYGYLGHSRVEGQLSVAQVWQLVQVAPSSPRR